MELYTVRRALPKMHLAGFYLTIFISLPGDDIQISDPDDNDADEVPDSPAKKAEKLNGLTEEECGNSTSDIEDNDIRETLSDDSDQIQVLLLLLFTNSNCCH